MSHDAPLPCVGAATIRAADERDFAAITAIYAHHVHTGTATFEIIAPDEAEMRRRHAEVRARGLPWIVADVDGRIAGYAYAGVYRVRPAYRFTVEDSLYLEPASMRRGLGRALLARLLDECTRAGCRQMLAVIGDSANAASIGLHRALGFVDAGIQRQVGLKFGRWIDTVIMQRTLGAGGTTIPADTDAGINLKT